MIAHARTWAEEGRDLFERLTYATVPEDPAERAAVHVALQVSAPLGKVVDVVGVQWRTSGYADLSPSAKRLAFQERLKPSGVIRRIEEVGRAFDRCTSLEVIRGDARQVAPRPARAVYIDPPYVGVTGYRHELPRADVVSMAIAHAQVADAVAVSEHEAIPELLELGWKAIPMKGDDDKRDGFTRGEVLTVWRRPR